MDRETLFQYFEQNYISKQSVLPWLPLGMNPDAVWEELQKRRKAKCILLPIHGSGGEPCWYVTTERMIAASERVVEELMAYQPPLEPTVLAPPEENYYTSFLEGIEISPEEAMQFILSNNEPTSADEQKIHNNRYGLAFAEMNLYHPLDDRFIRTLAEIVTTNMENGGGQYRKTDNIQIESMGGEQYSILPSRFIPDSMGEISAFLANPGIHPMIKAGIAQAWVLMTRPFTAGNERLARLLSLVVLHRAGYSFFGKVSFSALIASNGYAYYEAVNSLLRKENGGDMTYFLDYFLQLLAHAAEEYRRKVEEETTKTLAAERQMAGTVLAPANNDTELDEEDIPEMDITDFTFLGSGDPYSDDQVELLDTAADLTPVEQEIEGNPEQQKGGEWVGESRARTRLEQAFTARSREYKRLLLQYLESGKYVFSSKDVVDALKKNQSTVTAFLRKLVEGNVLQIVREKPGAVTIYTFDIGDETFAETDYSEELIKMISTLATTYRSSRDSRIGSALQRCIPYGYITINTYKELNEEEKWQSDMEFAEQIGLVRKVNDECYFIFREINHRFEQLNSHQKRRATEMYNSFGSELFSQKMLVARLSYSENVAKVVLHEFRLLRILDCHKDGISMYQFRVNPKENPECFDQSAA